MADIPGFPVLKISDDHKAQAAKLYADIKVANPQHEGFFRTLEDKATSGLDLAVEAAFVPVLCLAMLFDGRKNAFM